MLFYRTQAVAGRSETGNHGKAGRSHCVIDSFRVSLFWGGALGFDTLAAQTVLRLRKNYPQIKLIRVLLCISQADRWAPEDVKTYREIMKQADKVVYTSQDYTPGCMFKRNRHLVDYSSACICYLAKKSGGTTYTVEYARKYGLKICDVAET